MLPTQEVSMMSVMSHVRGVVVLLLETHRIDG